MNILVIDDDPSLRRTLRVSLEVLGHQAVEARDGTTALQQLGRRPLEMALLDLHLGQEKGLDLLPQLLRLAPGLQVVIITAYATIETAVEAMRRGACDYLPKPFTPDQLRMVLERIAHMRRLQFQVDESGGSGPLRRARGGSGNQRSRHAASSGGGFQDGCQRSDDPVAGRKRHGQGGVGPGNSCPQRPGGGAVCHDPLPESFCRIAGERVVRARAGSFHRGGERHRGKGGRRRRGNAVLG